ncbi:hypothetical protein LSAT2_012175 [Lamellibrachia satsuma]|nr:hypothetical protein LSAT2_012175 [Lamellibrachia satsuma]
MTPSSYLNVRRRVLHVVFIVVSILVIAAIYMGIPAGFKFTNRTLVPLFRNANTVSDNMNSLPTAFLTAISDADDAILENILRKFTEVANKANLTYFMYWGTLIGAYRHHGRIPWDDDVDLMVPAAHKKRMIAAFASLSPTYVIDRSAQYRWKFFAGNSTSIKGVTWKFPFIDLSFYLENGELISDEDPNYRRRNTYSRADVFPLCRRPFSGMTLPAPRNARVFLRQQFDIDECVSSGYNHRTETRIAAAGQLSFPCTKLWGLLPFVFRTKTSHGTNETLKIGNKVVDWKMVLDCAS